MSLWDFLDAHPVWGFIYLATIVMGALAGVASIAEARKTRHKVDALLEGFKLDLEKSKNDSEMN